MQDLLQTNIMENDIINENKCPKVSSFKYTPPTNIKSFQVHPQYEKYLKKTEPPTTNLSFKSIIEEKLHSHGDKLHRTIGQNSTLHNKYFHMSDNIVFYSDINNKKYSNIVKTLFNNSSTTKKL